MHEHLLVFRREHAWFIARTATRRWTEDLRNSTRPTWRDLVAAALADAGGTATLPQIYAAIDGAAKTAANRHWKAKIRQVLQLGAEFTPAGDRGVWTLAA